MENSIKTAEKTIPCEESEYFKKIQSLTLRDLIILFGIKFINLYNSISWQIHIYLPLGFGTLYTFHMYDYFLNMMVARPCNSVEAVNFKSTSRLARLFFLLTKYPPSSNPPFYFLKFRNNPCTYDYNIYFPIICEISIVKELPCWGRSVTSWATPFRYCTYLYHREKKI